MDLTFWKSRYDQGLAVLEPFWPYIAAAISLSLAIYVTAHVAQNKRDARAAAAWTGLVWLVPVLGAVLYFMLGVNRIQRRARQLTGGLIDSDDGWRVAAEAVPTVPHLQVLSRLVGRLTHLPLTDGNELALLDAPQTYQAMLDAINGASESIYLVTYIFGNDAAGKPLVEALAAAVKRGVKVRVLIDGMGAHYSLPSVVWRLRRRGVPVQRFLYSLAPWRMPYINLRNHRKIMIVDRSLGFTGGMNIRAGYLHKPARPTDLHARLEGPVGSLPAEKCWRPATVALPRWGMFRRGVSAPARMRILINAVLPCWRPLAVPSTVSALSLPISCRI